MNRRIFAVLSCWICLSLAGSSLADSLDLPDSALVQTRAAAEITATAKELAEHKWPEAEAWKDATAGEAVIAWSYAESVNALRPAYWLVEVRKDKEVVGLLGLSPQEGTFVWRSTRLSKAQKKLAVRLLGSKPEAMAKALKEGPYDAVNIDFDHTVLTSVNGSFYWVAPTRGENLVASLALPASGEGKALELWEALSLGRSALPDRLVPEASGPVVDLPRDGLGGADASTQMVGAVPLLADLGAPNGWAHALSMVRQWWSPMTLGSREDLRATWQATAAIEAGQGASVQTLYRLTANGPGAKAGYAFETLRTLWFGPGKSISRAGDVGSDKVDDLREWILRETPVIAAIDADGTGKTEGADQYVLITGFSDADRRVYVNNPFGLADTFAYESFDEDYWGAWYTEQCKSPTVCESPQHFRRGLVAAAPGDFVGPPMPRPGLSVPEIGTDSAPVTVANISLSMEGPKAPAFAGADLFGQSYQTECRVDAPGGRFHGGGDKGGWTELRDTRGNEMVVVTASHGEMLFPGQFIGGGRFDLTFPDSQPAANITVTATCTVHDADDRAHFLHKRTVTVFDDSVKDGGQKAMPLPLLRPAVATATATLALRDDDPAPPEIKQLSPAIIWDSDSGNHRFEVQLSDASPIEAAQVAYAFENKEPKSFGSFDGNKNGRYWKSIPRKELLEKVGSTLYVWVKAQDGDNDRKNDGASGVRKFTIAIQDDDPLGPVVVQYVARRAENMQFQVYVHLQDASGVYVDHAWPKLYYSFKGTVSADSFDGIAKLVAAPKLGPGWFTAVAPWGEQGALAWAADKEKKEDTFIYLKVRSYDLDKDRKNDDAETWSQSWSEVYLPAPLTDTTTIVDIWPAGDRETGVNSLWDDWFDPPPKHVPFNLFFEGRPAEVSPPPVPEVLTGQNAKIRIHITVSLAFVHSGAHLAITGASLSLAPYKLDAAIVSKKGIYELGSMTFPSEEKEGAVEVKVEVPSGALSTGENILVLRPAKGTGEYDQISIQRIHLEANELPKPPKIEGIGIE